ncbi:MAG: acyltransferase [Sphingobium sp.]|nr:acyltransferase [Sphingobium sp.]
MRSVSSAKTAGRLAEIDALRGLGAIGVILYHYTARFPEIFPYADHVPFAFWPGEYRVLLFFVISGFSIFFSLRHIEGGVDFAVNRFARLFPCYWVAILLTLMVEWIGGADRLLVSFASVIVNFTMMQDYFYIPAVDGAYWTLGLELGFYLSMFVLWRLLGRNLANLEWALMLWLGVKIFAFYWDGFPWRLILVLVLEYLPFFIIGMLFHRIWSGQRSWKEQIPFFAMTLMTVLLVDGQLLFIVACGLVILCMLMLGGWLRFLCFGPLLWLGQISYPLYLVHENIGFVIMLKSGEAGLNHWLGFALAISVAMLLAALMHYYVELPFNRRLMNWWQGVKRRDVASVSG